MITQKFEKNVSKIFSVLGNPFRIKLVLALWAQESCVCHLEALLKKRQAYISQHLMALREANMLETRREGKFVYYKLANPEVIKLIRAAGLLAGIESKEIPGQQDIAVLERCICPHCEGEN